MIHTDGKPTISSSGSLPSIYDSTTRVVDPVAKRVELPDDPRVIAYVIEHALRVIIDEITPGIASGKLTTSEEVLGVLMLVQADYAAEGN